MDAAKQVYDFMNNARVFFLATVEGDQPRVRVYGATLYFEILVSAKTFCFSAAMQK